MPAQMNQQMHRSKPASLWSAAASAAPSSAGIDVSGGLTFAQRASPVANANSLFCAGIGAESCKSMRIFLTVSFAVAAAAKNNAFVRPVHVTRPNRDLGL